MFAFRHSKIIYCAGNFKENKIEGREDKCSYENDTNEAKRWPDGPENNG